MNTTQLQVWSPRDGSWINRGTPSDREQAVLLVATSADTFYRGVDVETGSLTVVPKMHGEGTMEYLHRAQFEVAVLAG